MYTNIHVYIVIDNACSMNIERTNNFFFIITGCLLVMSRHLCFKKKRMASTSILPSCSILSNKHLWAICLPRTLPILKPNQSSDLYHSVSHHLSHSPCKDTSHIRLPWCYNMKEEWLPYRLRSSVHTIRFLPHNAGILPSSPLATAHCFPSHWWVYLPHCTPLRWSSATHQTRRSYSLRHWYRSHLLSYRYGHNVEWCGCWE